MTNFKYHPDPLKTGYANTIDFVCVCCNKEKKIAYIGPIHESTGLEEELEEKEEKLCLDCIYDGSAAKKFDATFNCLADDIDADLFREDQETKEYKYFYKDIDQNGLKMSKEDLEELYERTPGFLCLQDSVWLIHCQTICAFYGDFEPTELQHVYLDKVNKKYLKEQLEGCSDQQLKDAVLSYDPLGSVSVAFYKFKCLACEKVLVHADFT